MNGKRIISLALILFFIIGIVACDGKEKTTFTNKAQPQMMAGHSEKQAHAMVQLPTVQCGTCKETIETGLSKIDGIVSVNVDLADKLGHINFDPMKIDVSSIEKAIAALGYQANETMADTDAYSKLPNCCKLPEDRM